MTSPFLGFENATLAFAVADGTYTINSVGNRIPSTTTEIIKAVLKPATDASTVERYAKEIQQFAGADGYATLLEGYLVEPKTYPQSVEFLMESDIVLSTSLGKTDEGRFKLLPVVQSPYVVAMGIDLITPIKGVFRRSIN
ncbi:hypothetical protein ACE1AT_04710 [Pelatocladus sp. BLCC-F211]|uniref:hypothetical protein n=1 Tax=Pelatocladus sp. BLCC-F211 TaxID=3342752 RepID=UPI0035BB1F5D